MNAITFVVAEKNSPDDRYPFAILRLTDRRQDVVSYHATEDEAKLAAQRYTSKARFAGLDARIFQWSALVDGTG